ncbi:MAG: filamentous hemagglutinin N-terminal domain-containing protein [Nostoc sp. DedQUE08]|uniref:two-partner secretion domain-containing protein n=1 Tax=unclassified Nostoc TaxID=2593658 RepID=UPI002AD54606|nr:MULTISPECIES: filamentous hemagglutinin N-terminal domain-containing protein [unclassified Nostoc]MDZ8030417.1 filamentous hemagglutinin N-terminal domain-containing protein [Nostoc sp. DedSLP04]MDZ8064379.1 filamentous hemagglutinin N-terminal domain-containing protein [Nostoc sp. DedQUE08]MDZ8092360.1 filamentous hemagglutinin N-terminal domain-containing protein [Nostoc sp. DedQUE05]
MSGIQDWRCWCSSLTVGSVLITCLQNRVFAQKITPDNTLPNNSSVAKEGNTFNITGGTQAGSNLFHSFSEFSVPTGGTASFNNALDIQNIITRVTGGSISNIDGLIRANGKANLFLLNPNGIIFEVNARLDIGGSFLATTASSFKWSDGSTFSATNPQLASELLAINPSALFFNQLQAAKIKNRSTTDAGNNLKGLRVRDARSLLLVGGDIILDGGSLNALGGLVELAGVSGNGTVGLNVDSQDLSLSVPNGVQRADISLSHGVVDVSAGGGGSIIVNARNLDLKQQSQLIAGIKSGLGTATATAGDIKINATDTVALDNSPVRSRVEENGQGKAGGVSITTGSLAVTNGAQVSASTLGKGDAGSVTIFARNTVKFDGEDKYGFDSGAYSQVRPGGEGKAGGVSITTGSLAVTNGAQLGASTFAKGDAGSVSIFARNTVKFDGEDKNGVNSGAYSQVNFGAEGKAGGVSITTGSLEVTNGAQIDASTFGKGDAGSVSIFANTFEASNGGQVSTITSGEFHAGNITFHVKDNITLSGLKTGLFASTSEGSIGNGGNIIIDPRIMTIRDGATIAVNSQGEGIGGNIQLTAGFLTLDRGTISAATRSNTGGNITLNLQELLLRDRSQITTNAGVDQFGGNGGNIKITAPNGFILAVPSENSDITANAFTGSGGRVDIQATGIYGIEFRESPTVLSDITASSEFGTQGTVELNTPDVDPNSGLVQLPTTLVDTQVAQGCYSPDYAQNRFVIAGRGGLPPNPQDILTPDVPQIDWVSVKPTNNNRSIPPVSSTTISTPKRIVEATGATLNAKGQIVLSANSSAAPYTFRHNPIQCHGR